MYCYQNIVKTRLGSIVTLVITFFPTLMLNLLRPCNSASTVNAIAYKRNV